MSPRITEKGAADAERVIAALRRLESEAVGQFVGSSASEIGKIVGMSPSECSALLWRMARRGETYIVGRDRRARSSGAVAPTPLWAAGKDRSLMKKIRARERRYGSARRRRSATASETPPVAKVHDNEHTVTLPGRHPVSLRVAAMLAAYVTDDERRQVDVAAKMVGGGA